MIANEQIGEIGDCYPLPGITAQPVPPPAEAVLRERATLSLELLQLVLASRARTTNARLAVDACSVHRYLYPRVPPDFLPAALLAQRDSLQPHASGNCFRSFVGAVDGHRMVVNMIDLGGPAEPVVRLRVVNAPHVHRESYDLRLNSAGFWIVFETRTCGAYLIRR